MFSSIISTANDIIALFNTAKSKLLNKPEEASGKLADVLGELTLIMDFHRKGNGSLPANYFPSGQKQFH